jgi:hypothetical protein
MSENASRAIAIVGVSAILPDAPDAATFWSNVCSGRYSISDVPEGRWDPDYYYDPDPKAPDKTYSRIGGWVTEWTWDPFAWKLPIPSEDQPRPWTMRRSGPWPARTWRCWTTAMRSARSIASARR